MVWSSLMWTLGWSESVSVRSRRIIGYIVSFFVIWICWMLGLRVSYSNASDLLLYTSRIRLLLGDRHWVSSLHCAVESSFGVELPNGVVKWFRWFGRQAHRLLILFRVEIWWKYSDWCHRRGDRWWHHQPSCCWVLLFVTKFRIVVLEIFESFLCLLEG